MNELELKHVAPYLPYGLKIASAYLDSRELIGLRNDKGCDCVWVIFERNSKDLSAHVNINKIKLILRPMSDLKKEIEVNGNKFVPFEVLENILRSLGNSNLLGTHTLNRLMNKEFPIEYKIGITPYAIIQKLFEWHFDVFDLIEQGMAVNINNSKLLK
jgi:hypothetical protein